MIEECLTLIQRVAIGFPAGVIGGLAVVLFDRILFRSGLSATFGVKAPISLSSPDIYKPLFWGGLWGVLFGLFIEPSRNHIYLIGLLYFLLPVLALYIIFLPRSGAGFFGLKQGPMFALYLLLVNIPFGIVTALAVVGIIGNKTCFL